MKTEWYNYPDQKPVTPEGETYIDVIVRNSELRPYYMTFSKAKQKFSASDAIIIQWKYKRS